MSENINHPGTLLNFLQMDLKRAFLNWRFLSSAIVIWLLMLLEILPIILHYGSSITWYYMFQYAESGEFQMVFYMCAVFPYACAFLEDYQDGYGTFLLSRGVKKNYALSKCLAVIISACGVILVAFSGFFVAMRFSFPDKADRSVSSFIPYFYTSWLNAGNGFGYVFSRAMLTGFAAAMFGVIALTASVYLRDKLIICALPLLLFYLISDLSFLIKLPETIDLYVLMQGNPGIGSDIVNYLYSIGVFLLIILMVSKLFIKLVGERVWV